MFVGSAWMAAHPGASAQDAVAAVTARPLDPIALASVQQTLALCLQANGSNPCWEKGARYTKDTPAAAAAVSKGAAVGAVGYSEVLLATLSSSDTSIQLMPYAVDNAHAGGHALGFVDAFVKGSQCLGACADAATRFVKWATSQGTYVMTPIVPVPVPVSVSMSMWTPCFPVQVECVSILLDSEQLPVCLRVWRQGCVLYVKSRTLSCVLQVLLPLLASADTMAGLLLSRDAPEGSRRRYLVSATLPVYNDQTILKDPAFVQVWAVVLCLSAPRRSESAASTAPSSCRPTDG